VALVEGDNELAFDLERVLCVELLLENLKLRGSVTLTEIFPEPNEMPARGPEGRFVHEIIVPCVRQLDARPPARVVSLPVPADSFVPRQFAPGTEWLYINVYCGSAGADVLLRELVRPLADQLLSSTTIDRWFFIRYSDPDWHLRLRLHGEPSRLLSEALPLVERMTARHIGEGRVSRWTVGTYERELERYGGSAAIELCEEVFFHDSVAALSIIEAYQGDAGLEARWRLAVLGIDCLLTDLGCELSDKLQIMRPLRDGMSAEFHAELTLNSQIGQKFRLERRNLEAALNPENTDLGTLAIGNCILEQRSLQLQPPMQALELLENQGRLTINRRQIAPAFIHMFANRLLRSAHRPQELVLYDFLTRYYESQVARAKRQPIGRPV
jgi:thiopeptide-type bacteriocin biosynthesis protein